MVGVVSLTEQLFASLIDLSAYFEGENMQIVRTNAQNAYLSEQKQFNFKHQIWIYFFFCDILSQYSMSAGGAYMTVLEQFANDKYKLLHFLSTMQVDIR